MAKRTKFQVFKDCLVVIFCLAGLVFFVFGSAHYINQLRPKKLSQQRPAHTTSAPSKPGAPASPETTASQASPTTNELATIFSGASSLALIMFSLLLALAAIIGWQSLKHDVETVKNRAETVLEKTERTNRLSVRRVRRLQETLKGDMTKKNELIEQELRGRVHTVMGNLIGTLHSRPDVEEQSEADQEFLADAVYFSEQAYKKLQHLPGLGKYPALNNLVYYSALLNLEDAKESLLRQARELLAVGKEHAHLPYATPYFMTYARAILVYSSDPSELEEALGTARKVLQKGGLTKLTEREARYVEASLSKKLERLRQAS